METKSHTCCFDVFAAAIKTSQSVALHDSSASATLSAIFWLWPHYSLSQCTYILPRTTKLGQKSKTHPHDRSTTNIALNFGSKIGYIRTRSWVEI